MLKITLATGNPHKVEEINLIAKDYNIEFVLPDGEFNPIEDSDDFIGNAYCKAKCASLSKTTELYLADDSGICVEALNNEPGIHSARYAPSAKERINKLLGVMNGIKNRKAYFTCAMVIVDKNASILFQTQQFCHGEILEEEVGTGGFGYDPIFYVKEEEMGMAELTAEKKAQVSHRAKALNEVLKWIKNEYAKEQN